MDQRGGSQYGAPRPEMNPFSPPTTAASPISSRPPSSFEELGPSATSGGFLEEDVLVGGAEGGAPGSRWPREETLALLKIRQEMDVAFRDATLKGPLWQEVSRKLADLGYARSAKKCKEKFENLHKYYKRTKDGRGGRQDGKNYRFFSELEALYSGRPSTDPTSFPTSADAAPPAPSSRGGIGSVVGPSDMQQATSPIPASPISAAAPAGTSFTSGTCSSSSCSESDTEDTEEAVPNERRKRKRCGGPGGGSRKMMAFFEGLMRQLMDRQDAMQHKFLEAMEKKEQDRLMREEAWRRQETARLNREQELAAQERALAASRDAAVIGLLQKISGETIQLPPSDSAVPVAPPSQPKPAPTPPTPPPNPQHQHQQQLQEAAQHPPPLQPSSSSLELVPLQDSYETAAAAGFEISSSSRWPKAEVDALITLRTGLEFKYQESGPKGPFWEDISAEMRRLGYNRSAKRCKEKWENINKYFKKVKESNKKRTEDSKTCPYFHQLDALYRKKFSVAGGGGGGGEGPIQAHQMPQELETNSTLPSHGKAKVLATVEPPQAPPLEVEIKNGGISDPESAQRKTTNGGPPGSLFEEGTSGGKKERQRHGVVMDNHDELNQPDGHNMDCNADNADEEDVEDTKMEYDIQFQRPNGGEISDNVPVKTVAAAGGSILAMVQ